jgi:hypothetical protein
MRLNPRGPGSRGSCFVAAAGIGPHTAPLGVVRVKAEAWLLVDGADVEWCGSVEAGAWSLRGCCEGSRLGVGPRRGYGRSAAGCSAGVIAPLPGGVVITPSGSISSMRSDASRQGSMSAFRAASSRAG